MSHRQLAVSAETVTEQITLAKSQHQEEERAALDHFDTETALICAEISSFQQKIAQCEERLQELQMRFDEGKERRKDAYNAHVRDIVFAASDSMTLLGERSIRSVSSTNDQRSSAFRGERTRNTLGGRRFDGFGHTLSPDLGDEGLQNREAAETRDPTPDGPNYSPSSRSQSSSPPQIFMIRSRQTAVPSTASPSLRQAPAPGDKRPRPGESDAAGTSKKLKRTNTINFEGNTSGSELSREGSQNGEAAETSDPTPEGSIYSPPGRSRSSPPPQIPTTRSRQMAVLSKSSPSVRSAPAPGDKRPRPGQSDAAGTSKKLKPMNTIEFEHIYQKGQAIRKYKIVEFPKDGRRWYIFSGCEECKSLFKPSQPLTGAQRHLQARHAQAGIPSTSAKAVELFGVEVLQCSPELMSQNNRVFDESLGEF